MKKKFDILRYADDKYIEEADPTRALPKKSRLALLIAAVLTLTVLCAAILMPMSLREVSSYGKIRNGISAYLELYGSKGTANDGLPDGMGGADIMEDFNEAIFGTYAPPENEAVKPDRDPTGTPNKDDSDEIDKYEEVTDNQVEGVIEGDIIKRSSTHIFYVRNGSVEIYNIAGLDSRCVGEIEIGIEGGKPSTLQIKEIFLSPDAKTLTVILSYVKADDKLSYTRAANYDVSDPENVKKISHFDMSGSYLSARYIGKRLIVMSNMQLYESALDLKDKSTYLPQISDKKGKLRVFAEGDIVIPDETSKLQYTVVTVRDTETLESIGEKAFFSYMSEVYVTKTDMYFTSIYAHMTESSDSMLRDAMTDITCVSIDAMEVKGTATVRGYVKDQYSMDEYNGILRVVTTTNTTDIPKEHLNNGYGYGYGYGFAIATATGRSNASLYCITLDSFKVVSSVIDFAPPREEVRSVRFDGDKAYVCTAIEVSDPVFFFDLSDINNITWKDTGTIQGFSSSLVNLKDGYLLGFGSADWSTAKIEIYEEAQDGVESVCSYTFSNSSLSGEYKSYYIDRTNNIFGFALNGQNSKYIFLHFDGEELVALLKLDTAGDAALQRGLIIEKYAYVFHDGGLTVKPIQ